MIATSANVTPCAAAVAARARFPPGEAVLRSAHTAPCVPCVPCATDAAPARSAPSAAEALLTLSTR